MFLLRKPIIFSRLALDKYFCNNSSTISELPTSSGLSKVETISL